MRSEQDRADQHDREVLAHEILGDSFEVLGETLNLLVEKTLESQPAENLPIRLPEALRAENIFGTLFGRAADITNWHGKFIEEQAKVGDGATAAYNATVKFLAEKFVDKSLDAITGGAFSVVAKAGNYTGHLAPVMREMLDEHSVLQEPEGRFQINELREDFLEGFAICEMLRLVNKGRRFLTGAVATSFTSSFVYLQRCQEYKQEMCLIASNELYRRFGEFVQEAKVFSAEALEQYKISQQQQRQFDYEQSVAFCDSTVQMIKTAGDNIRSYFSREDHEVASRWDQDCPGMDLTMTGRMSASNLASGMSQTSDHSGARRGGLFGHPFRETPASHTDFRPPAEIPVFLQSPNIAESLLPGLSQGVYAGVGDRLPGGRIAGDGFSSPFLPEALRISGTEQPFLQNLQQFSQVLNQHCGAEALGMVAKMTQDIADQHVMRTRDFFATLPPIPQIGDNITFQTTTTPGGDVQTTATIPVPKSGDNAKVGVGISAAGVITLSLKLALTGPQTAVVGGALLVAGGAYLAWDELISPTILRGKGTKRISNALKKDWVDSAERNFQYCLSKDKFSSPEQRRSYADFIADASIKRMGDEWHKKSPEEQAKFVLSKNSENTHALAALAEIGLQKAVEDKKYYGDAIKYADDLKRTLGADAKRYGDLLSRVYITFSGDRIEGGEPDVARSYLDEARRLNPSDKKIQSHVSYLRGMIAQKEDDLTTAASHFQEAENFDPKHLDAKRSRVDILLQQEDSAEALELQKTITTSAGSTSKDTLLLAHLCSDQDKKEEAIKLYESYLIKNPEDKEVRIFLMDEQVRGGQYAEASQRAKEYEEKFGKDEKVKAVTDAVQKHSDMEQARSGMAAAQRCQELADEASQPSRLERGLETAAVIANAASAGIAFFEAGRDLRKVQTERREQAAAHEREIANITVYGLPAPRLHIAAWRQEAPAATLDGRREQRVRAFNQFMSGNFL